MVLVFFSISNFMSVLTNLQDKLNLKQFFFDVDLICYLKQRKKSHKDEARSHLQPIKSSKYEENLN